MRVLLAALATLFIAAPSTLKVDVGEANYGLAAGGGSLWVGGLDGGDVLRLEATSGRVLRRIGVGVRVFNLASAPGAVWAVSNVTSTVTRIDTRSGKVTGTVRVGAAPYDVAWGFGSIWVSNSGDGTVSRVTGTRVVKTIRVGIEPNGLAAIGGALWVTDHTAGKLVRIDPKTNRVTGSVKLPGADWVTESAGSLWVSEETDVVARVDPATLKVLARVPVQRNPLGSAVVRGQLWVPCIDAGVVVVIDPRSGKIVRTFAAGPGPIVALPVGGHIWVSHSTGNAVWRF